jgi:transcriptional regulator with XRE-family HTH domain
VKTRPTRLRLWREAAGLTLQEFCDLTGTTTSMLSRAEREAPVPGTGGREWAPLKSFAPLTKARIARRLGVRVADLFEVEDDPELEEASTA